MTTMGRVPSHECPTTMTVTADAHITSTTFSFLPPFFSTPTEFRLSAAAESPTSNKTGSGNRSPREREKKKIEQIKENAKKRFL